MSTSEIQPGDRVRSFDFPDRSRDLQGPFASYIEGVVEAIGRFPERVQVPWDAYRIRVERRVVQGHAVKVEEEVLAYPPVNGTPYLLGGVCDGVERIG